MRTFAATAAVIAGVLGIGCKQARTALRSAPPSSGQLIVTRAEGSCTYEENGRWRALTNNQAIQPGHRLRTGPDSFLDLASSLDPTRLVLTSNSQIGIDKLTAATNAVPPSVELKVDIQRGFLLAKIPPLSPVSLYEFTYTNGVNGIRGPSTGPFDVFGFGINGDVLAKSGTIISVWVPPGGTRPPITTTVPAGQMFDSRTTSLKPLPVSSNAIFDLLK